MMSKYVTTLKSDEIKGAKDKAEAKWALEAAMNVYNAGTEVMNKLISNYNALWEDIDINPLNDDGTINDEASYNMRYEEWHKLQYDAMSYIHGVNPKTKRIVKLDFPYVLINKDLTESVIFAHIEDFEMN